MASCGSAYRGFEARRHVTVSSSPDTPSVAAGGRRSGLEIFQRRSRGATGDLRLEGNQRGDSPDTGDSSASVADSAGVPLNEVILAFMKKTAAQRMSARGRGAPVLATGLP